MYINRVHFLNRGKNILTYIFYDVKENISIDFVYILKGKHFMRKKIGKNKR